MQLYGANRIKQDKCSIGKLFSFKTDQVSKVITKVIKTLAGCLASIPMDIFSFVWFELTKVLTQKSTLQAKMCIKSKFR